MTAAVRLAVENERLRGQVEARASEVRTLPTGHVTFLFTDIEGSTSLLQRLGDRYAPLLADLRAVIRGAVHRAGGREVDARADKFFAVFDRAGAALEAALAIERAVRGRAWPAGVRFRDLGSHRLRRLREPQAIFQVGAADLPSRFPALRASAVSRGESDDR